MGPSEAGAPGGGEARIRAAAVVPAAGEGRRMGGRPKPFLELAGVPVLLRALGPFLEHPSVEWIVVALREEALREPPPWLRELGRRVRLVPGGATRTDSVRAGLGAVPRAAEVVLVHDAARPLLPRGVVDRCLRVAARGVGAVAAWPVPDTVKEVGAGGRVLGTPDRSRLWLAQTPQAFPREMVVEAYRRAAEDGVTGTDDAALVERYGGEVRVVEGSPRNVKITTPEDLRVAEALLAGEG